MSSTGAPSGRRGAGEAATTVCDTTVSESRREIAIPMFDQVFREFAPFVLRTLPRLGVRGPDAEDVCQEIFVAVARQLASFERRSTLRTWVYGIAIRKAANYRRKQTRARNNYGVPEDETAQLEDGTDVARAVEARQTLALAERIIRELPSAQREVFVLFEIEQLDMGEVARAVDCPLFTAYGRLYAARKRIRAGLRRAKHGEGHP